MLEPTFRSYFWEITSEAGLHCRGVRNLYFVKPLGKLFQIQTAECGLESYEIENIEQLRAIADILRLRIY